MISIRIDLKLMALTLSLFQSIILNAMAVLIYITCFIAILSFFKDKSVKCPLWT